MLKDKAKQLLIKFVLEPEWEAKFEPNSYGFRPGRSCQDAIASLYILLARKNNYILNIDIHKCFDEINYSMILKKISTFNEIRNQIKLWLKANIMSEFQEEFNIVTQILERVNQRGIIAPLLYNITVHGLEQHIKNWNLFYSYLIYTDSHFKIEKQRESSIGFSRYADQFILTATSYLSIKKIKKQIRKWLKKEIGLKLSKAKINLLKSTSGFEFLGFQFITIRLSGSDKYKLKISPSKKSKTQLIKCVHRFIKNNKSASSYSLIIYLSSKILSWASYFCYLKCFQTFSKLDYMIFRQIKTWVFRRRSNKFKAKIRLKEKYLPSHRIYLFKGNKYKNNWVLNGRILNKTTGIIKNNYLPRISWVKALKYIKIKNNISPYNGDNLYWAKRI